MARAIGPGSTAGVDFVVNEISALAV